MDGVAGSMRQRGTESWELRVHIGRDPETGKKQYATRTVRGSRREAERALARLVAEVEDGAVAVRAGTVAELCERWFSRVEPDLSPTTAHGYRLLLDRRILPRFGDTPLRRLRTSDLDQWYSELRRRGGAGGRPLAPNTVMRVHAVLHRALAQALRWGWITTNPAANATPGRPRRSDISPPSPEDVIRLVEAAGRINPGLPVFLRLAAATGARRGELCALRWREVDLGARQLTIGRALAQVGRQVIEKGTKTHATRRIGLDAGTIDALQAHRRRAEELARQAGRRLPADAFVFSHAVDGTSPWRPGYVTVAFTRLRNELGVPVRLHDLRHFTATRLLAAGTDVRTVSGRLGHANAGTTLNVYAHFLESADHDAADTIGQLLDRPPHPRETSRK